MAFLKPSLGLIVRDPRTKVPLSVDGENKPIAGRMGVYWKRRIRDGSVIVIAEQKEKHSVLKVVTAKTKGKNHGGIND